MTEFIAAGKTVIHCISCGADVEAARPNRKQYCKNCYHSRQIAQQNQRYHEHATPKKCIDCGTSIPARCKRCPECRERFRSQYDRDKSVRRRQSTPEALRKYEREYQRKRRGTPAEHWRKP